MKLGLRSKIIAIAALVIIFVTASFALSGTLVYLHHHAEVLQSRSQAVARGLAIQLERVTALGLDIHDVTGFEAQCAEAVSAYPGVSYALVAAQDGTVLFSSRPELSGKPLAEPELLKALQKGSRSTEVEAEQSLAVLESVRGSNDPQIASVIVAFPRSDIDQKLRSMLLLGLGAGGSVAVIGLLVLYLMLRHFVTRPISRLMQVVAHLQAHPGDYSPRVPPQQDDEIGLLVNGFNQLLDNIEERERELIEARDNSDKANRMKSDFLAAMSHDLRTPMHAILSMNELLRSTALTEKQQRYSLNVHKAGQWLLGIINDILAFAKIDSGRLELMHADFNLQQLVEDTVALQEDFASSKKLELSFAISPELPRHLNGDAPRLMQMLTNLISNAIKYTDQGSVHLDITPLHNRISFSVTDTGVGIDKSKLHLLFEPFVQVANADGQRRSGTGLGLSIVKQLAEAMGGEVGVDSSLKNGATFWFTARLQPAIHPAPDAPPAT
ncbi:sensor histidine kinase [Uliginosibacterium aquaticum]|uniref:histidine kinase n=1 Tax=Uliginosibacterium aquaticum TaxID=2731212 RepID=A0ABX2IFH2_9RHOO|nr:ATP-binding protein [Uliginosibacterium aquaticum]NSL55202.1 HAMP domain-containing protein [Uliginosibacterium aquaticum]